MPRARNERRRKSQVAPTNGEGPSDSEISREEAARALRNALEEHVSVMTDPAERRAAMRDAFIEAAERFQDSKPDVAGRVKEVIEGLNRIERQEAERKTLSSPVALVVDLQNVFIEEFSARRTPEGVSGAVHRAHTSIGDGVAWDLTEQGLLHVRLPLGLRIHRDEDVLQERTPAAEIQCLFVLVYGISSSEGLGNDNLSAFAQTSSVFSAWPYWREFVHSASMRMSLPPVVLPTYRA